MNNPKSSGQHDEEPDVLAELKKLLLGDEQESITELRHHVFDLGQRTKDIAEVLPDSIQTASKDKKEMVSALTEVNYESIRSLIDKNPESFADALFPVMGPAIRKSINETLKSFMQSLNHVLEQNMSVQGLKWRLEAVKKGVPYTELVLKYTLVYRVDEVFLIHRNSGLLISHIAHPSVELQDSDAVSAMLSAIQDFVKDSFSTGANSGLDTVELGDHTLWVMQGPNAILACAIRGIAPQQLRLELKQVLESLHSHYGEKLRDFAGDQSEFEEAEEYLQPCLREQSAIPQTEKKKKAVSTPLLVVLIVLVVGTGLITWYSMDKSNRLARLAADLNARDGVVVYSSELGSEPYQYNLLLDPLADDLTLVAAKYGFDEDEIRLVSRPYRSLDAGIKDKRMRQILKAPASVNLKTEGNLLHISGIAPVEWTTYVSSLNPAVYEYENIETGNLAVDYSILINSLRKQFNIPQEITVSMSNRALSLAGSTDVRWLNWIKDQSIGHEDIESVDLSGLSPEKNSLIVWLGEVLAVPDTAAIEVAENRAIISGTAPFNWRSRIEQENIEIPWIASFDMSGLAIDEELELARLKTALQSDSLYFKKLVKLTDASELILSKNVTKITRINTLAQILKRDLQIEVQGYSDGTGNPKRNQALALKRAQKIRALLIEQSEIDADKITAKAGDTIDSGEIDYSRRRVDFHVRERSANAN